MQELWKLKINWDTTLPAAAHTRWTDFQRVLPNINKLTIPRKIIPFFSWSQIQLHGLCDASIIWSMHIHLCYKSRRKSLVSTALFESKDNTSQNSDVTAFGIMRCSTLVTIIYDG